MTMKKHNFLFAFLLLACFSSFVYSSQKPVTEQEKPKEEEKKNEIDTILNEVIVDAEQVLTTCRTYEDCEKAVFKIIDREKVSNRGNYPAIKILDRIERELRDEASSRRFVSQLIAFNALTPEGQNNFRAGVRIKSLSATLQDAKSLYGDSRSSTFSKTTVKRESPHLYKDDVFIFIIQEMEKNHASCSNYAECLRNDISIIKKVEDLLDKNDPILYQVVELQNKVLEQARSQKFNPLPVLEKYRDLNEGLKPAVVSNVNPDEIKWDKIRTPANAVEWRAPEFVNLPTLQVQQKEVEKEKAGIKFTPKEKQGKIEAALTSAFETVKQVQASCKTRKACEEATLKALNRLKESLDRDNPGQQVLKDVMQEIKEESDKNSFSSQLRAFNHLSAEGQGNYRAGTRIKDFSAAVSQVNSLYGGSSYDSKKSQGVKKETPRFNKDDAIIFAIQQMDENHRNCSDYKSCLSGDIAALKKVEDLLNKDDPARYEVQSVREEVSENAQQQIFNPISVLERYRLINEGQPVPATAITPTEAQWEEIRRSSPAKVWYDPRLVNLAQLQAQANQPKDETANKSAKKNTKDKKFEKVGEKAVDNIVGGLMKKFGF